MSGSSRASPGKTLSLVWFGRDTGYYYGDDDAIANAAGGDDDGGRRSEPMLALLIRRPLGFVCVFCTLLALWAHAGLICWLDECAYFVGVYFVQEAYYYAYYYYYDEEEEEAGLEEDDDFETAGYV